MKKSLAALAVLTFSVTSLAACGSGSESVGTTTTTVDVAATKGKGLCDIVRSKKQRRKCNKAGRKIKKSVEKAYDDVAKAADDATKWVDKSSKELAKKVTNEYRNAKGQIVDAMDTIVNYLPTSWPDLTDTLKKEVGGYLREQFYNVMDEVDGIDLIADIEDYVDCVTTAAKSTTQVVSYTTGDAEPKSTYKDPSGCAMPAALTKSQVLDNLNDTLDAITWGMKPFLPLIAWVPVVSLGSEVKDGWWTDEERKANITVKLDFFGLKKYEFGLACVNFSKDGYSASSVSINGGCGNPWGLDVAYKEVMKFVKKKAAQAENLANDLAQCVKIKKTDTKVAGVSVYTVDENCPDKVKDQVKDLLKAASKYQNPRNAPVDVVKTPMNWILAVPPLGVQLATKSFLDDMEGLFPFASWLVPSVQSVIARSNADAWKNGQINLATGISYAGQALYTSDIACIEFGTSWDQAPKVFAEGGCDRKWGVELGGVTVYEEND